MYGSFIDKFEQTLNISSVIEELDVSFRAFLTDMSQNFTSTWQSEEVYGRNDPISTFSSTKRVISVAWEVPSANLKEAKANLEKCNTLIKMTYPSYIKAREPGFDVIAKNPLVYVGFGNIIADSEGGPLLGWMDAVSWKPVLDMGMFNETVGEFYPKVISLSFNLNVLHQEPLGQETIKSKNFPFNIT
jgi:hypothetical protein